MISFPVGQLSPNPVDVVERGVVVMRWFWKRWRGYRLAKQLQRMTAFYESLLNRFSHHSETFVDWVEQFAQFLDADFLPVLCQCVDTRRFTNASVMVYSQASCRLVMLGSYRVSEASAEVAFKPGEGAAGKAYQQGIVVILDDIKKPPDSNDYVANRPPEQIEYRSLISVPLETRGKCRGALTVTHATPKYFTKNREVQSLLGQAARVVSHGLGLADLLRP